MEPILQRNPTLDVAKGIGIGAVVLGHSPLLATPEWAELKRVIFSFHMPLFFFLSGLFLRKEDELGRFVASRAEALLKPYFVVLAGLGLFELMRGIAKGSATPGYEYLAGVLYANGATIAWTPMWFLPHLFLASCLSLVLIKRVESSLYRWLLVAFLLVGGVVAMRMAWGRTPSGNGLPWSLDILPVSCSFIVMGYLLRDAVSAIPLKVYPVGIAILIFSSLHYGIDVTMDLNMRVYGNFLVSTVQAALGIYLCLSLASLLVSANLFQIISHVGSGTLFVLIFHATLQYRAYQALYARTDSEVISAIAGFFAGILLPLLLLWIVRRNKGLSNILLPGRVARMGRALQ